MNGVEDLRAFAAQLRRVAGLAIGVAVGLSLESEREWLLEEARELAAEAARLEARANSIEALRPRPHGIDG